MAGRGSTRIDSLTRDYYLRKLGLPTPDTDPASSPSFVAATAGAPAAPITVTGRYNYSVQMVGAGTIQVQGSLDGVTWNNVGAAISTPGITQLPSGTYYQMRVTVSSGTPNVFLMASAQ